MLSWRITKFHKPLNMYCIYISLIGILIFSAPRNFVWSKVDQCFLVCKDACIEILIHLEEWCTIKLLAFCLIINYNPPPHTHNPYKPTSSPYLLSYLLSFLVCHQTILRKYIVIFMNNCKNIIQSNIIVLSKFLYTSLHAIIVLINVF